ncbi:MAG: CoA-binding protein [Hyperthermus sp.]|nr:MAG: CoA-binding protein [Hyperthermus sp.]
MCTVPERPGVGEGVEVFFNPKGVAVIGASREPGKVGHMVLYNLKHSFTGPIYPVNPRAKEVLGLPAYPTVLEVPDPLDLAVVAVPARIVPRVVEEAGERGVRGVIVLSAGFRETGREGARLEEELVKTVYEYGMRMIGPNCIGVYSPASSLNATFFDPERQGFPPPGPIAFLSQSGALGASILDWAATRGIGVSRFVSLGNKADVDEADILAFLRRDPHTRSIAMYIEGVAEGRRFRRALEETTPLKPVVVLKAGRTEAGARAAASHTGSLAGSYSIYEAVFKQTGVIPTGSSEELFDIALALALQPPPKGPRVGIVTLGGGSGVLAADEAVSLGLKVPRLSAQLQAKLRRRLPPIASTQNPVDVTASATDEHLLSAIALLAESDEVDSIIIIPYFNIATISDEFPRKMAAIISHVAGKKTKPILAAVTGGEKAWDKARAMEEESSIPAYPSEARAVKALWALYRYGEWLRRHRGGEG